MILKQLLKSCSPVLVSSNKDVFLNLALEHWLYSNLQFKKNPIVLIWTDEPCVVIGRHQNPWVESTLGFINRSKQVKLARRHSGGGCVYHDENNINISIIGDRSTFENRQSNLSFLAKVFKEKYDINCEPTKRHDLIHSDTGFKISGSAAKLGRFNCYHHFTVLVDTDKEALYTSIRQKQQDFIQTNSSLSTRSKVINLKEIKQDLNVDQVISDLAEAYGQLYKDPEAKQPAERRDTIKGDEDDMKTLSKFKDELESWDWIYGKTPKFKLERNFKLIEGGQEKEVRFSVLVNKGLFERIEIDSDLSCQSPADNFNSLIGTKFNYKEAMTNVAQLLKVDSDLGSDANISIGTEKLFATFLLQMIHESNY